MTTTLNLNTKIIKNNPLILAEFERAFEEVHHDLCNGLLHIMQNVFEIDSARLDLANYEQITDRKVLIDATVLKQLGNFGKNSNSQIFDALKEISDTSAVLRNFTDVDGKKVKKKTVRIIDDVRLLAEGETGDGRAQAFEVQFNEWFLQVSTRQFNVERGNYTPISAPLISTIRGKHAKKLYEIVKAQQGKNAEFGISFDRAKVLFNLKDDAAFSHFVQLLKRNAPKVESHIPFCYTVHKSDKHVSFHIENDKCEK